MTIVPSDQLLFGIDNRTILVNEKKLIYNDTNHLTIEGTRFALAPLLEPIFDTIANQ